MEEVSLVPSLLISYTIKRMNILA